MNPQHVLNCVKNRESGQANQQYRQKQTLSPIEIKQIMSTKTNNKSQFYWLHWEEKCHSVGDVEKHLFRIISKTDEPRTRFLTYARNRATTLNCPEQLCQNVDGHNSQHKIKHNT